MTLLAQFAATGGALPAYIEDVFSTWLWTGNDAAQTINNGVNLASNGGMVWSKSRSAVERHYIEDTVRGASNSLNSASTASQDTVGLISAFNSNGFDIYGPSGVTYASWTFRKQSKFFDIVTWTGNSSSRTLSHSLGSVPGCIIVKRTVGSAMDWYVYHQSLGSGQYINLNLTSAATSSSGFWGSGPTSTDFTVPNTLNIGGSQYVAYLFAHNAGGFGLTGTDNVISCGSFTTDGSGNATVDLGYEPQWLLYRRSQSESNWFMIDTMRGWDMTNRALLNANLSDAESTAATNIRPTATGFSYTAGSTSTPFIYIAIRRGPMKTPTSGTSVFAPVTQNTTSNPTVTTNFPVDLAIGADRTGSSKYAVDRLRGTTASASQYVTTNTTDAEATSSGGLNFANNTGFTDAFLGYSSTIFWNFRRAPGFFDEVCYTGTGSATTVTHNLGVAPELMIVKSRGASSNWFVYHASLGNATAISMNYGFASYSSSIWNNTTPTASVFSLDSNGNTNGSGGTYVWYGFASAPGVSKVGSYTGTGTTLQIDCGFTGGARFVLIKRTDSTGDWYVWDSARGIVAGNDPYLLLNSTAAEVTGTDYVDTYTGGFEISSTAPAAINANGGTFIYLAIA